MAVYLCDSRKRLSNDHSGLSVFCVVEQEIRLETLNPVLSSVLKKRNAWIRSVT